MIDLGLYGCLIRAERVNRGISTANGFSEFIKEKTGYYISRDILYKIEQGKQEPKAIQFMAISLALFGTLIPDGILKLCKE